uniref:Uncharacterized protein n=1 Tax=Romanomermis culicivorax TaxID=13658 RepID=A0A915KI48_ROMCU
MNKRRHRMDDENYQMMGTEGAWPHLSPSPAGYGRGMGSGVAPKGINFQQIYLQSDVQQLSAAYSECPSIEFVLFYALIFLIDVIIEIDYLMSMRGYKKKVIL